MGTASMNPDGSTPEARSNEQVTELRCGSTHIQFFKGNACIATVRTEYAQAFRDGLKKNEPAAG